jgi:molecular chaperone HscA
VITVPAHFDDAARIATKNAAQIAGIDVLRIINEPTAAAIAYRLNLNDGDITLVYDLGGGTFDVSILKQHHGVTTVIATGGDNNLGGDDFDNQILKLLCEKASCQFTVNLKDLKIASQCKKCLSRFDEWSGIFNGKQISVTVNEMIESCQYLIDKTIKTTKNVLNSANLKVNEIANVILAGGGTKMPIVQKEVQKLFNGKIYNTIDENLVVAIGAVMHAESMTNKGNVLIDVTP